MVKLDKFITVAQYSLSDVLPFNHLDDSSFSLALYELQNGPVHFDPDRFSSLRYNPIFSNSNASLTQSGSLDPDINFNAVETPCDYFILLTIITNSFNLKENFVDGQNNSKCRDGVPLTRLEELLLK